MGGIVGPCHEVCSASQGPPDCFPKWLHLSAFLQQCLCTPGTGSGRCGYVRLLGGSPGLTEGRRGLFFASTTPRDYPAQGFTRQSK